MLLLFFLFRCFNPADGNFISGLGDSLCFRNFLLIFPGLDPAGNPDILSDRQLFAETGVASPRNAGYVIRFIIIAVDRKQIIGDFTA